MSSTPDNAETGIAVLADENTTLEHSTWRVNGVALSENAVTMGGSKRRRIWPADVLREAADLLADRPIVKNFHDLEGSATADDVVGRIWDAGYQDGVGLVFEGEISDESIATKVGNDFLELSAVPGVASESYDASRDAYVVEEISGFRDVAVVPDGADRGNEIAIGERPAIAALSREALAQPWDVLQDTTVSDPVYNGYDSQEWERPTLEGDGRLGFGGDMGAARDSATHIEGDGEDFSDLSLFVVDGNNNLNLNGLDSAWQMAPSTDGVSSDEVSQLRSMYEGLAEQARESGAMSDEMWGEWQSRIEGEGDEGESNEANANAARSTSGLRAALERDLELTGTTPARCKTIKDGARVIDPSSSPAARETLGTAGETMAEMELSGHEQASATALLGLGDDTTDSWTVTRSRRAGPGGGEDVLAQQILSSGRDGDGTDADADTLQDENRTPQPGDAVRWRSDSGGEREPSEWRYGVIVDGLQDKADDQVLVAVYQANSDGDGWENRNEQNQMSRENLEAVGTDGKASLPPVSQVT